MPVCEFHGWTFRVVQRRPTVESERTSASGTAISMRLLYVGGVLAAGLMAILLVVDMEYVQNLTHKHIVHNMYPLQADGPCDCPCADEAQQTPASSPPSLVNHSSTRPTLQLTHPPNLPQTEPMTEPALPPVGNVSFSNATFCEHSTKVVELRCSNQVQVIFIELAEYGRRSRQICPHESTKNFNFPLSENALDLVQGKCLKKSSCTVSMEEINRVVGDAYWSVAKYLVVRYACVSVSMVDGLVQRQKQHNTQDRLRKQQQLQALHADAPLEAEADAGDCEHGPPDKWFMDVQNWTMHYTRYARRPLSQTCQSRHKQVLAEAAELEKNPDVKLIVYPNQTKAWTASACTYQKPNCVSTGSKLAAPIKNRFGQDTITFMPPCCLQKMTDTFHHAIACIEKTGVEYSICHGTLLGWARYGTLQPHDYDNDIAMSKEDKRRLNKDESFLTCLAKHGHSWDPKGNSILTSLTHGVKIDVWEAQFKGSLWYIHEMSHLYGNPLLTDVRPLVRLQFAGIQVWGPRNPRAALNAWYKHWRIPQMDWAHLNAYQLRNLRPGSPVLDAWEANTTLITT